MLFINGKVFDIDGRIGRTNKQQQMVETRAETQRFIIRGNYSRGCKRKTTKSQNMAGSSSQYTGGFSWPVILVYC